MLQVKDTIFLKIKKHEMYQLCEMDLVSHRGLTLILFGRSVIQPVCLFDVYLFVPFHLMAKKFSFLKEGLPSLKTACAPCMLGTLPNLVIILHCTITMS